MSDAQKNHINTVISQINEQETARQQAHARLNESRERVISLGANTSTINQTCRLMVDLNTVYSLAN